MELSTSTNEPLGSENKLASIIDTSSNLNTTETGDKRWLQ